MDHDMTRRTLFPPPPIKPPRNNNNTYNLFSTADPHPFFDTIQEGDDLDLDPCQPCYFGGIGYAPPKGSIAVDYGCFEFDRENVALRPMAGSRRGSASIFASHGPEVLVRGSPGMCEACKVYPIIGILKPCNHRLCNLCIQVKKNQALQNIAKMGIDCHLCDMVVTEIIPYNPNESSLSINAPRLNPFAPARSQPSSIRPLSETSSYMVANFSNNPLQSLPTYVSPAGGAVPFVPDLLANPILAASQQQQVQRAPAPVAWAVVKLSNIPWDISQNDIRLFFSHLQLPSQSVVSQPIHVELYLITRNKFITTFIYLLRKYMYIRTTGKTLSDAYVEISHRTDLTKAVESRHMKPLKGRLVSVTVVTQEELMHVIFPRWRGDFTGIDAIVPDVATLKTISTAAGGGDMTTPPFVTREEINSLLVVCRNYKLHFSRKCAERPFENIISVIAKYPWHQPQLITTLHRDHVYEMLKLAIGMYSAIRTVVDSSRYRISSHPSLQRLRPHRPNAYAALGEERNYVSGIHGKAEDHAVAHRDIAHFMLPPNCLISGSGDGNGHDLLSGNNQRNTIGGMPDKNLFECMQVPFDFTFDFNLQSALRTPEPQEHTFWASSSTYPTPPSDKQSHRSEQSELEMKMEQFSGELKQAQLQLKAASSRLPLGNLTNRPTYDLESKMEQLGFSHLTQDNSSAFVQQKEADLAIKVQNLLRSMSSTAAVPSMTAMTPATTGALKEKSIVQPSNANVAKTTTRVPSASSKGKENMVDPERLLVGVKNKRQMKAGAPGVSRTW
ncbi:hypothetical protein BC938DRAFT_474859 [Jimgerdemannia flammicorona]|uniref:RING-type domain-containing protein n=1 Tax=Jimgerdemannia flammicorona TaxID=994334 RepID=A0A433Q1D0_9FUNG|nr:hypothetical protein BC938DRAFT_474859 [Jimgerdemannia flammicorona]